MDFSEQIRAFRFRRLFLLLLYVSPLVGIVWGFAHFFPSLVERFGARFFATLMGGLMIYAGVRSIKREQFIDENDSMIKVRRHPIRFWLHIFIMLVGGFFWILVGWSL